jgi:lambda repressor-like predicted transcriptional regulator
MKKHDTAILHAMFEQGLPLRDISEKTGLSTRTLSNRKSEWKTSRAAQLAQGLEVPDPKDIVAYARECLLVAMAATRQELLTYPSPRAAEVMGSLVKTALDYAKQTGEMPETTLTLCIELDDLPPNP